MPSRKGTPTSVLILLLIGSSAAAAPPPNLVILFADDLGYGDLGCYGHPTIRTPRLDRMASLGIKLTSFYAAPVCSPSRAALLTGRYPPRTGIYRVLGPDDAGGLPASEITLAEALRARAYRTSAIGKWHLGHQLRSFLPTQNGFDEYLGLLYSNDMTPPWVDTRRPLRLYRDSEPIEGPVDQASLTETYTERAIDFIHRSRSSPFFLYLAYTMPHVPLAASPHFAGRSPRGLYGDVVETIDWSVGAILDALRAEGLEERTLVVFTSDNGPWQHMPPRMFNEGRIQVEDAGSAGPLRGWKGTTYEGGVRVPCIACWPGRIAPGQVSSGIACTMDLYTTFLHLAGAKPPADRRVDGLDILPLLLGPGQPGAGSEGGKSPREEFLYFNGKSLEAVRQGKWKLRLARDEDDALHDRGLRPQLFDLERDPSESHDLAASQPELVARLRARLKEAARETEVGRALETVRRF